MRFAILALLLAALVPATATASSDRAYPVKVVWKFARGVSNILRSPGEIPVNSYKEARGSQLAGENQGGQMLGYFTGTITGIGYMLARIGVGVFDIATFPIPTKSLMQPPVPDGFIGMLTSDQEITNRPPRHHFKQRAHTEAPLR